MVGQGERSSFFGPGLQKVENGTRNLVVDSIQVGSQSTVYAGDTYINGSTFYVPVYVIMRNIGNLSAGQFGATLQIYWNTGGQEVDLTEWTVPGLGANENTTLIFYWGPANKGNYTLTAVVDNQDDVSEDNEADNILSKRNVMVSPIGDINGDGRVNIFDAVILCLAWGSDPGSANWNVAADINHNEAVDIYDAMRISLHWGETR